jgi:hypothetical protein
VRTGTTSVLTKVRGESVLKVADTAEVEDQVYKEFLQLICLIFKINVPKSAVTVKSFLPCKSEAA